MDNNNLDDILDDVLKISPPAVVSSVVIFGLPLADWVYVFTIIYTIVGIIALIKKHWFSNNITKKEINNEEKDDKN